MADRLGAASDFEDSGSIQATVAAVQSAHAIIAAARQDQATHIKQFGYSLQSAASAYQNADDHGAHGIGGTV